VRTTLHLALGSNVGDRRAAIEGGLRAFAALVDAREVRSSGLVETAPAEGAIGGPFLNAVAVLAFDTPEAATLPERLLFAAHRVEAAYGRDRTREGWHGARPLDLDLLALSLDGVPVVRPEAPALPHPGLERRAFVLGPLAEVDPDFCHPLTRRSARDALAALRAEPEETA